MALFCAMPVILAMFIIILPCNFYGTCTKTMQVILYYTVSNISITHIKIYSGIAV